MTNNTDTQTITCDSPEASHPGFPCNHPLPSLAHLADLNRQFQAAKNDLLDNLGKVDENRICDLALLANELRTELREAMDLRRKANA